MEIAVARPGLECPTGGTRYDRALIEALRERGDHVEEVVVPRWRWRPTSIDHGDVDALVVDGLCAPVSWPERTAQPLVCGLVHLLGDGSRRRWLAERRFLSRIDAAVCPSEDTRRRVTGRTAIPATVAPPAGRMGEPAGTPRDEAPTLRVAHVGALVPRKGQLTLLAALEELTGDWRAVVVGSLRADPAYARAVTQSAGDRVTVTGAVSDTDVEDVLAWADVVAVPSRRESFGMVYLEAMERAAVPVGSPVGGATELIDHGQNGLLVPPDDPGQLAVILERLATEDGLRCRLAEGALQTAAAHPTWSETARRVRSFLELGVAARG